MNEEKQWYRRVQISQKQEKIWRTMSKISGLNGEIRRIKNRSRGKIEQEPEQKR